MARDRTLSLSRSSQESYGSLYPEESTAHQVDYSKEPEYRPLSPSHKAARSSPGRTRLESRTPVLVVEDYSASRQFGKEQTSIPRSSSGLTELEVRPAPSPASMGGGYSNFEQDHLEERQEDYSTAVLVGVDYHPLLHSKSSQHSLLSDGPIAHSDPFSVTSEKVSYLPHPIQDLDVAQFTSQVTKVSTRLDMLENEILENQSTFKNEPTFRAGLYGRIEQQVIQELISLQNTYRVNTRSTPQPCASCAADDVDTDDKRRRDERKGHGGAESSTKLMAEHIDALKTRTRSLISGLIASLTEEKQLTANQIEYEWNKEVNHGTLRPGHSRGCSASSDTPTLYDDPSTFRLFSQMGLNHLDSDPAASQNYSEEVHKVLNAAVRNSTSYPEARKSSLFIKSNFDLILRIQGELHQLNHIMSLVRLPLTLSTKKGFQILIERYWLLAVGC
ncbi:uncharacterized protein VP01_1683g3 [Puccinia sorghi]|uniref:Uncharacterized protein n=1 Tax=Puccinia sorghi TaxID=27349 RepID=A0A0L6VHT0_9BASI|nr:uncharacterized protein VP01_1683g3 [Puccinia sorghi]